MELLRTSAGMITLGTVLAGLLVFALAARLPTLFPHSFTRLVGFITVFIGLVTTWMLTESWHTPALLGGASLAVMGVIHIIQVRRDT